ncbi:hypothetical protein CONPUDRAFT_74806 [Coniophora puteana RWD-64-598 SS2]|uniref:Serine/threonine-protein kinase TEL1 n=1 Tax=Coniophora puteana (strain RWD-64-598) TaxID=741705 RepID=A0A5M3MJC6_CONPW|nr:uncharacterized protein CONPUDRAFT_74806 [Coniophora puteana RWD-64-598 SS2]EIW79348.1 hypothetical protein CONPUDRAFT_74806 [Coniophora puteana RWD-64-598 SS2]
MNNLNTVLQQLKSDKVKERQEGISSIRNVFTRDHAVDNLDDTQDGRAWLVVFQAIFTNVLKEKEATAKKSGAAPALRRLDDAVSCLRWLTLRSVHLLNKKVIKPLMAHLLQMMVDKGELNGHVCLDYLKIIRCVLSWTPHLENLEESTWIDLVKMAFNVVLGDPLRRKLDECLDDGGEIDAMDVDDSMYQNDSGVDEEEGALTASSRKRRRDASATPGPSSKRLHSSKTGPTASLEQIEFTSLLVILLRSPSAPLVASQYPYMPSAILVRMRRFLEKFPGDTSLHHDYLIALQAVLSHYALNQTDEVKRFAQDSWDGLVGLWGTKNKQLKEFLLDTGGGPPSAWSDRIYRLWHLLNGEADIRWGVDNLLLECIRLEVSTLNKGKNNTEPFICRTFRAGWHFDASQAMAWAVLELQADCVNQLFNYSESIHNATLNPAMAGNKHQRREDPITTLLFSIQSASHNSVRVYRLQVLLFFIDRYWFRIHDTLQDSVISVLVQFISFDDPIVQSWVFVCLAAIAEAEGAQLSLLSSQQQHVAARQSTNQTFDIWDPIWTHAMRRANVPTVYRAACHTAYTLMRFSQHFLASHRMLSEIETFAKDLETQGPTAPTDSVCVFLTEALRIAGQDVRLYRMQLEEKVLAWLLDNLRLGRAKDTTMERYRMPLYTPGDLLILLQGVIAVPKRCEFAWSPSLPESSIVDVLMDEKSTQPLRDYILRAKLLDTQDGHRNISSSEEPQSYFEDQITVDENDLLQPNGRVRRISGTLLSSLETVLSRFEAFAEAKSHLTAEVLRQSLDAAVVSLSFESLMVYNGTRPNKRVIQLAGNVISLIAPLITDSKWTSEERLLILRGLELLISDGTSGNRNVAWDTMLAAGSGTGVKTQRSGDSRSRRAIQSVGSRSRFRQVLWRNPEIREIFGPVSGALKDTLRVYSGQGSGGDHAANVSDKDGFGPIRTGQSSDPTNEKGMSDNLRISVVKTAVDLLALLPMLQATSAEPVRDRELTNFFMECSDADFIALGPSYFDQVGKRLLNLSADTLDQFLLKLEPMLGQYAYKRSEEVILYACHILNSTMHLWLQDSFANADVGDHVRELCSWLARVARERKIRSWRIRDTICRFLSNYVKLDPEQIFWSTENGDAHSPSFLLPMMGADDDTRVRFRAATCNAQLLSHLQKAGVDESLLYDEIKKWLTRDLGEFEQMLTRMLTLGNLMVVSSTVRRGPYWHLIEAAFHSSLYTRYIQAILRAVSDRMGLSKHSDLFEAYASQIASSIRQAGQDIMRLPPSLLGYTSRKECADSTFLAFTPTNLLAVDTDPNATEHGQDLFLSHCAAMEKEPKEALKESLGTLIGFLLVQWLDGCPAQDRSTEQLEQLFASRNIRLAEYDGLERCIKYNADRVVTMILCTLADQDFTTEGPVFRALHELDSTRPAAMVFRSLSQYRRLDDCSLHHPNLPAFGTLAVISSLNWCFDIVPKEHMRALLFHVLHQMFAEIHRTPLINEQMRLLNGITLFVALHHQDMHDPTLLYGFARQSSALLQEVMLVPAAQSFLQWSFSVYKAKGIDEPRLPDVLIRTCVAAHSYATISEDKTAISLGNRLLSWIDDQTYDLAQVPALWPQVMNALSAWPHQPSTQLLTMYQDINYERLSATLGDHRILSNKFRLVRRMRDLAAKQTYDKEQFARVDFWRLKGSIPANNQILDHDVEAFASLLVLNAGGIYSFKKEQTMASSMRQMHRYNVSKQDPTLRKSSQKAIVEVLLSLLDGDAPSVADLAYRTLRSLMSVQSADAILLQSWASDQRTCLTYLQQYPVGTCTKAAANLVHLAVGQSRAECDFATWITMITTTQRCFATVSAQGSGECSTKSFIDSSVTEINALTVLRRCPTVHGYACLMSAVYWSNNPDLLAYDKWLDIDHDLLARSAVRCGAYTTALLFLELSVEKEKPRRNPQDTEQIMFDIYSHIDEPDGFYGIATADMSAFLIRRFHHEKQWDKAFRFHGAGLEARDDSRNDADGLLSAFRAFGFDHLAVGALHNTQVGGDSHSQSSTLSYQLGWRTETWNLPDRLDTSNAGLSIYRSLRGVFRERDPEATRVITQAACRDEIARMRELGSENIMEIRQVAQNLMCLNQIDKWTNVGMQQSLARRSIEVEDQVAIASIDPRFEFSDMESIMATRLSLLHSARQKEQRDQIGAMTTPFLQQLIELEKQCLINLSEAARQSDQLQIALNSVVKARRLESEKALDVSQEFAHVLWRLNEQRPAVQFLREVTQQPNMAKGNVSSTFKRQNALSLATLGTWSSEGCLERPADITTQFFIPAVRLAGELENYTEHACGEACSSVYHQYAMFAEQQYQTIIKSPDMIRWKIYVDRKMQEIRQREDQMKQVPRSQPGYEEQKRNQDHELKRARAILEADTISYEQLKQAQFAFLVQALEMYSRCLSSADKYDDDGPIRLCSLWLANFDSPELQTSLANILPRIPSRKFVFLAHQLSARMAKSDDILESQANLQSLVLRMCREHPFHSLYQVYSLSPEQSSNSRRSSSRHQASSQTARAEAAISVLQRLRADPACCDRLEAVERLCEAAIQWANHRLPKAPPKGSTMIPDTFAIRSIKALRIPVMTAHTPIDPTLEYKNCVLISHYETHYKTAGGISMPKICVCVGDNGEKFTQLFKGHDDLRQDAVMEQVFDLVNAVLRVDRETRRRSLSVRGYKVIPLAPQAGVLEFVTNTTPLRNWVADAHQRYRPKDLTFLKTTDLLRDARQQNSSQGPLVTTYKTIQKKFQPVMRYYFTEKHKHPMAWFAMRLGYTRSVATTSITGHVLGLGDRHLSNILMDNISGEVVHIDLGIAFDQACHTLGKLLPVPERVPFRMTRDMVDGMGISGTQGVFQRCAEETLRVLRERSDVIMTVLEVFKYDPLHSWTASEFKLQQVQSSANTDANQVPAPAITRAGTRAGDIDLDLDSGSASEAADRALSSVSRKLSKALSVEYVVNELVSEATDVVNLATIFVALRRHDS